MFILVFDEIDEEIITFLHVRNPSLSLSHYISTLVLLLLNRDSNSFANPEPQLKV